jgi:hypothetical protein
MSAFVYLKTKVGKWFLCVLNSVLDQLGDYWPIVFGLVLAGCCVWAVYEVGCLLDWLSRVSGH